jgi:hypothetical protein
MPRPYTLGSTDGHLDCCAVGLKDAPKGPDHPTPEDDRFWAAALEWLPRFGTAPLVLAGAPERFPKLQILFAETRLGRVPFRPGHTDRRYARHLRWAEGYPGFEPLKHPSRGYERQNVHFTVQYEHVAVGQRPHLHR